MTARGPYKQPEDQLSCRIDVKLTPAEMRAFEIVRGQRTRSSYLRLLVQRAIKRAPKQNSNAQLAPES